MKNTAWILIAVLIMGLGLYQSIQAGLATRIPYATGTPVLAAAVNANEDGMVTSINQVETIQIVNGTILNADINAAAGITDGKLATISTAGKVNSTAMVGTEWGDLTDSGTTVLHTHDGSIIVFSSTGYDATNLADAILEVGDFVGYDKTSTGSVGAIRFIGLAIDTSSEWPTSNPAATVTVTANAAPNGIVADITASFEGMGDLAAFCMGVIPLNINGVNLSIAGAHVERYVSMAGCSNCSMSSRHSTRIIYQTGDGWRATQTNTVAVGAPYARADSTCGATDLIKNFNIVVSGF